MTYEPDFETVQEELRRNNRVATMPDDCSNAEQAAFVAGMLEAADICDYSGYNFAGAAAISIRDAAEKVVPEGYRLVPVEPTQEMLRAAWNSASPGRSVGEDRDVWKAMLAAVKP